MIAIYQYGTPLAGRAMTATLSDGRTLQGTIDTSGKFHVSIETTGSAEEQALRLVAQLPQDNVAAAANVMLPSAPSRSRRTPAATSILMANRSGPR